MTPYCTITNISFSVHKTVSLYDVLRCCEKWVLEKYSVRVFEVMVRRKMFCLKASFTQVSWMIKSRSVSRDICHACDREIIIISIQALGRFWQEPEPSQSTGMAMARCILGKFLGVGCHCFPLPLDVPTFAAICLHAPSTRAVLVAKGGTVGENGPVILPK
jgi:hypothetical protein